MNLTEDDYNMLRAEEIAELNAWFDEQQEWENRPEVIRIKKDLEKINMEIDKLLGIYKDE